MTDVAIVVPCRDLGETLGQAIDSVLRQTRPVSEMVIVDDGSTDLLTRQVLARVARDGHRVITTPARGLAAARNTGVAHTIAPYVVALDADDLLADRYIERTAAVLDNQPGTAFVGTAVRGFGDAEWVWTPPPFELAHMLAEAGPPQSSMFRRELWNAIGGYDELLPAYEDIDFWLRAVEQGFKGHLLDEPLLLYRVRAASIHHGAVADGSHAAWMHAVHVKHRAEIEAAGTSVLDLKERYLEGHRRHLEVLQAECATLGSELETLDEQIGKLRLTLDALGVPAVDLGELRRRRPFSDIWGLDRGKPLDRYYIEHFLARHQADIRGRVIEVKDRGYTIAFGGDAVTRSDVLDINSRNPNATVVADLASADAVGSNLFDCFILTQTLHIIPDVRAALRESRRLLKDGGTLLLCTVPAVSRISYEEGAAASDYWRFTEAGLRRLFGEWFEPEHFDIVGFGNVLAATAFLYGLAPHELTGEELDDYDPWVPLLFGIRAVKVAT